MTSAWLASHGAISAGEPVSTLTTPPGTSLVASTSARLIAESGNRSLATTTTVLPATSAGATAETRPSSDESCGATIATTPVGSGTEMLKYGPATGLRVARDLGVLVGPARVPDPAVDRLVDLRGRRGAVTPSASAISATNWARRPSRSSAMR